MSRFPRQKSAYGQRALVGATSAAQRTAGRPFGRHRGRAMRATMHAPMRALSRPTGYLQGQPAHSPCASGSATAQRSSLTLVSPDSAQSALPNGPNRVKIGPTVHELLVVRTPDAARLAHAEACFRGRLCLFGCCGWSSRKRRPCCRRRA